MVIFLDRIIEQTLPRPLADVPMEDRVLNWVWWLFSWIQFFIYLFFLLIYSTTLYAGFFPVLCISMGIAVLAVGLLVMHIRGRTVIGLNIGILSILFAVILPAFVYEGIRFPPLVWVTPVVLFAAILQATRTSLFWIATFAALFTALWIWGPRGNPVLPSSVHMESWLHITGAFIVIMVQVFTFVHSYAGVVREKTRLQDHLQATLNEKRNLLRILSHDVGNSISIVEMALPRIRKELPSDHVAMSRLERAFQSMRDLLIEVRKWQAVNDGKQVLELDRHDLDAIIRKSIAEFEESLAEKGLQIVYTGTEANAVIDPFVMANQVLNNLISNAIKFSRNGETISIQVRDDGADVVIQVSDQGIGIPKELLAKVFSFDQQTSRIGTLGEKGTGFGLPILKTAIEKMGGRIEVTSQEAGSDSGSTGTVFSVVLKKKLD